MFNSLFPGDFLKFYPQKTSSNTPEQPPKHPDLH